MSFQETAWVVIELGRLRREADQRVEDARGPGAHEMLSIVPRALDNPALPELLALKRALEKLSENTVWKLVALMYAGRDKEPVRETYRTWRRPHFTKRDAIERLLDKTYMNEYVTAGIERAVSERVDLESGFSGANGIDW